jgi:hypothetical protein
MRGRIRKTMVTYSENLKRNLEGRSREGEAAAQPAT